MPILEVWTRSKTKHMEGVENLQLKVLQMIQRLRTEREVR